MMGSYTNTNDGKRQRKVLLHPLIQILTMKTHLTQIQSGKKIDRALFEVEVDQNPYEPKIQFKDLIKIWDNALDPEFCDHCIRKYEEDPYKYQGEVASGAWGDTKRSVDLTITDKDHWASEDKVFADCLTPKIEEYINGVTLFGQSFGDIFRLNAVASKFYDCGYQIQRTKPGDFYIWHNDFSLFQKEIS